MLKDEKRQALFQKINKLTHEIHFLQNSKSLSISNALLTVGWKMSCSYVIMQQAEWRFNSSCVKLKVGGPNVAYQVILCDLQELQRGMIVSRQFIPEASSLSCSVHGTTWKLRTSSLQLHFRAQRLAALVATQINPLGGRFG